MPFSDIRGQDNAIGLLKGYIDLERLGSAYIFSGPSSVGKKLSAKIFAQALNCNDGTGDACGRCPSCVKIENNQHPDVHIISGEGGLIRIEEVRRLQKDISLKNYEGRFKVFIIDDAHNLTPEAANCLLKVLEEPPGESLIILITDKVNLIFKTVISRCRMVKFRSIKRSEMEKYLRENYFLEPDQAHFIAYFSEGRFGRAGELKDADILRQKNSIIDKFMFSAESRSDINISEKKDFIFTLNVLFSWFRDIYLFKAGAGDSELINYDRRGEVMKLADQFSFGGIERIFNVFSNTAYYLERNINNKLLLHNLRAQICQS